MAAEFATHADWPSYGGTHSALRYSALDQINRSNVAKISPAWMFQTGDPESGLQSTPIVSDGVMYQPACAQTFPGVSAVRPSASKLPAMTQRRRPGCALKD